MIGGSRHVDVEKGWGAMWVSFVGKSWARMWKNDVKDEFFVREFYEYFN